VGKPNERERERSYYSASGKYITTAKSQFPAKRKIHLQHTKTVPKSASISVPNPYCCTTLLFCTSKLCQQSVVRTVLYGPETTTKSLKSASKICAKDCLDFRAHFHLLYGLYGSVQYGLPQQKNNSATKQISSLGFVPTFSWEMCPQFAANFPLSSLLRKISQSLSSRCVLHTTQCILL
jgi:hypothetical protein